MKLNRIRLGMIGGGIGSMVGPIHRYAARLDDCFELIGGVFSRDKSKSLLLAQELSLDMRRIYSNYHDLLVQESNLLPEERFEVIAILTPNAYHFSIAKSL